MDNQVNKSEFQKLPQTFIHLKSDRENRDEFWKTILDAGEKWDVVIDFSCLKVRHMRTIIEGPF